MKKKFKNLPDLGESITDLGEIFEASESEIARLLSGKMYRVDQLASHWNMSRRSIYRLLASGDLVGVPIRGSVRIPAASAANYAARQLLRDAFENGI